jgi:hypothetical protein
VLWSASFPAHCDSDHSGALYTLAALRRLSDDDSRFKLEIVSIRQNTDLEIGIAQFDLRCLVIQAYDHGDLFCGGRESRSRLTSNARSDRAIAGSTMKQTTAIAVRVAMSNRCLPRMQ